MYETILSAEQKQLLPLLKEFKNDFYLAGGTAIALHIGHRRSIDFDLFTNTPLKANVIAKKLKDSGLDVSPLYVASGQQDYLVNGVKCTFLYFPYNIAHDKKPDDIITMPSLIDLGATKVLALGRRSKWKDYVDLYFILKNHFSVEELIKKAEIYFPQQVTAKLFLNQLAYHKNIDYTEQVDFLVPNPPPEQEIKNYLIEIAIREL